MVAKVMERMQEWRGVVDEGEAYLGRGWSGAGKRKAAPIEGLDFTAMLRPAVYILSHEDEVVYVGKSKCPLVRIYAHRLRSKLTNIESEDRSFIFDSIHLIPAHIDALNALEQRLIRELRPRHNIRHKPTELFALLGIKSSIIGAGRRL